MKHPIAHIVAAASMALALVASTAPASAQDYPNKPIKVIVPSSAGGGLDTHARVLASFAPEFLNEQPMVIINKPGGAHVPGMTYVKESAPDGYTLAATAPSTVMLGNMFSDTGIDYLKDFKIIANLGIVKGAIYVHISSQHQTIQDLVDALKANPGKLRYAHTGRGAWADAAAQGFLLKNDLSALGVPFKGGAGARGAIVGNQVDFAVFGVNNIEGFEDQIRILGVISEERDVTMTEYPTLKELGIDFVEVNVPLGLAAPRDTPDEVVEALSAAVEQIVAHPPYIKLLNKAGAASVFMNAADARAYYERKESEWQAVVDEIKAAGN